MAVHRAQAAIHEAESKLRVLKKWERELETRTEPMIKLIEQLHGYLTTDMGKAVALLGEIVKTLQAYAEVGGMGGRRSDGVVEPEGSVTPPDVSDAPGMEEAK
jgi:hypothetical protein